MWKWLLVLLLVGVAHTDVGMDTVVVLRHENFEGGCNLYAYNRIGSDVTTQVWLTVADNVVSDPPMPVRRVLPGGQEVRVAVIRRDDDSRAWNCRWQSHWAHGNIDAHHDPNCVYSLPYPRGETYRIVQGYNGTFTHNGDDAYCLDFSFPEGTPIYACREGQVVAVEERQGHGRATPEFRELANFVRVKHPDGTIGEYDHLRQNGAEVQPGDSVTRGQLLGYSGDSGYAQGPHLHFFVYRARDAFHRESIPTRFWIAGSDRPTILQEGDRYTAP